MPRLKAAGFYGSHGKRVAVTFAALNSNSSHRTTSVEKLQETSSGCKKKKTTSEKNLKKKIYIGILEWDGLNTCYTQHYVDEEDRKPNVNNAGGY